MSSTTRPGTPQTADRILPAAIAERRTAALAAAPRLQLDARQESDVHCIAVGAFSPVTGFMGASDWTSVVHEMHLQSGALWPLPVLLTVSGGTARELRGQREIVLLGTDGVPLAILELSEIGEVDVETEVALCYGTSDPAHPGVAARFEQGGLILAGEVWALRRPRTSFPRHDLTPAQTRARFEELGWRTVVGFQTRNPVHRAHEYLHKVALETIDGLFLQPLVGVTKDDDIPADVRMRCYEVLLEQYYPRDRVVLGTYPATMRYAGPREAVLHALVRRNYGCTHFIVGRDHAGVGAYYGTYDAQRLLVELGPERLGITPVPFEHTYWCRTCTQIVSSRTCPHGRDHHLVLSGTAVRDLLRRGELPPPEFSRPEVARILVEATRAAAA